MASDAQVETPCLDLSRYELRLSGRRVKLERQPMELLIFLVEKNGQLVSREEIVQKLWGRDVFVDVDGGINAAIRKIRAALNDDPDQPKFLETVVGKGYRFIGKMELGTGAHATGPPPTPITPDSPRPQLPLRRRRMLLVGGAVAVAAGAVLWGWLVHGRKGRAQTTNVHSLAVLPLANLSGDASQDYLAEGMTDELITELAKISSLRVISRTSAMRYQKTGKSLPQIANELRVDTVVEGSVVRFGDRLRITAQLLEAATDRHLWAERYERDFRDVLTLQREVAAAIAGQVNATLTPTDHSRLAASPPLNTVAHEAYLRGLFFWNKWTEEGVRKSIDYLQEAIRADPTYAPAYAALANSYIAMGDFGVGVLPPHQANAAAEAAAQKAISLDEALADGHAALALARFRSDGGWREVEPEFRRAIELNPGSIAAHHWYSHYLLAAGRSEEAIAQGELAYDLSPVDPEMGVHMQFLYLFLHRYDEVIAAGHKITNLDPNFAETHWLNGQAYELKQMYNEAREELQAAVDLSGRRTAVLAALAHLLAVSGDRAGALKVLAELSVLSRRRYVPSYEKALIQVGLGNKDAAMAELENAYREGSHWMFILQTDARLDPLRSDARFQRLVRRVGLP